MDFWTKNENMKMSREQNFLWDMIWKTLDRFTAAYSWNGQVLYTIETQGVDAIVTTRVWTSNLKKLMSDTPKVKAISKLELGELLLKNNSALFLEEMYTNEEIDKFGASFDPSKTTLIPLARDGICYGILFVLNDIRDKFNSQDFSFVAELLSVIIEQDQNYTDLLSVYFKERDMMDILGHELRTPLTIGKNAMKYIKQDFERDGAVEPDIMKKYIDMAEENLDREAKLLETLLSTTKVDNDKIEIHLEKVDIVDVVNDSLDAFRRKAEEKGVAVQFNPPAEALIYADRNRVQEVVDNIIDNAVKYTNKGNIVIEIIPNDSEVIFKVADSGVGIPDSDIPKLGQKFYRVNTYVDSSQESNYKVVRPGGTGLGLYVTFNLVKLMGGKIQVESKVGEGSVFTVTFQAFSNQSEKDISGVMEGQAETGQNNQPKTKTTQERFEEMKRAREAQAGN